MATKRVRLTPGQMLIIGVLGLLAIESLIALTRPFVQFGSFYVTSAKAFMLILIRACVYGTIAVGIAMRREWARVLGIILLGALMLITLVNYLFLQFTDLPFTYFSQVLKVEQAIIDTDMMRLRSLTSAAIIWIVSILGILSLRKRFSRNS